MALAILGGNEPRQRNLIAGSDDFRCYYEETEPDATQPRENV